MKKYILAFDVGTSGNKTVIALVTGKILEVASKKLEKVGDLSLT